jgi:hypothetical protein
MQECHISSKPLNLIKKVKHCEVFRQPFSLWVVEVLWLSAQYYGPRKFRELLQ